MLGKNLIQAATGAAGGGGGAYIEDVFSTWLYDGNGSTQTITNGIDLSGQGGLVWIKGRSTSTGHRFVDTARGAMNSLDSTAATSAATEATGLTAFNSAGFSLGADGAHNASSQAFVAWTFRKQPKFFDIVTYTGTGINRTIAHNLGSVPGCIIVKCTNNGGTDWSVYHNSIANTEYLVLNNSSSKATNNNRWNSTSPTSSVFSVGTHNSVNNSGDTYVAYLFAHNAGGFGSSGTEDVISCGTYTGNTLNPGPTVTLGWEPQWVLVKKITGSTANWCLMDQMYGIEEELSPNTTSAETNNSNIKITATGFTLTSALSIVNGGADYLYIAIRRGPMRTPTDATEVFQPILYTGNNLKSRFVSTGIVTDMAWVRRRLDNIAGMVVGDRFRDQNYVLTGSTAAQVLDPDAFDNQLIGTVNYGNTFASMAGFYIGNDTTTDINNNTTANAHLALAFRRAPGFFDIVSYTGTGSNTTISHGLGVLPELIIVKSLLTAQAWAVYAGDATDYLLLNTSAATADVDTYWNDTAPTSSVFSLGTQSTTNSNGANYIAYLFATCPGVSKVGSYTGTGSTKQIDCGFTAGARFVMIKRTDTAGDWYIWDTARGIVNGNEPYLLLDSTAAEVTTNNYISPYSAGFEITSTAPAAINASGGSFIYLSIA